MPQTPTKPTFYKGSCGFNHGPHEPDMGPIWVRPVPNTVPKRPAAVGAGSTGRTDYIGGPVLGWWVQAGRLEVARRYEELVVPGSINVTRPGGEEGAAHERSAPNVARTLGASCFSYEPTHSTTVAILLQSYKSGPNFGFWRP